MLLPWRQKLLPTIANLHMGEFEDKYVYTYPMKPLFYSRFIDDGFFIWPRGINEVPTPPQEC